MLLSIPQVFLMFLDALMIYFAVALLKLSVVSLQGYSNSHVQYGPESLPSRYSDMLFGD